MFMIAGVDPGTTVGVAVIGIDGQVLFLNSYRNVRFSKVIKDLSEFSPVMIASDVTPVPSYVRKVSAAFDAVLFCPPEDIPVTEKTELTSIHSPKNDHERDALAAAMKAFAQFLPKIRKAKRLVEENEQSILRAALENVRFSDVLEDAIRVEKEKEPNEVSRLKKELGIEKRKVHKLEKDVEREKKKIRRLAHELVKAKKPKPRIVKKPKPKPKDKHLSAEEIEKLFQEYQH